MNNKSKWQKAINFYHKHDSLVTSVFFSVYAFWISIIWNKSKGDVSNLDKFDTLLAAITLAIYCLIAIFFKNKETTEHLKFKQDIKDKDSELADCNDKIEKLKLSLEEASEAITELKKQSIGDLFSLSSNFLGMLYSNLGLNHKDRLSIYIHNSENNYFSLVARYSYHTDYCKQHRQVFPDDQGILSSVWKGAIGAKKIIKLPEDPERYKNECIQTYNLPKEIIENLSMKSTRFLPVLIEKTRKPVGFFLIESIRKANDGHILINDNVENLSTTLKQSIPYVLDLIEMYNLMQERTNLGKEYDDE